MIRNKRKNWHRTLLPLLILAALIAARSSFAGVCDDWNLLQQQVRDGTIKRTAARQKVIALHAQLKKTYGGQIKGSGLAFPVTAHSPKAIGGVNGNGFSPAGYDFYDGNKHGGHPAHDIFIKDKNFDDLDDRTGKPVPIASMTDGVVIGVNPEWQYPSDIRGGIYVWIFNPRLNRYYYYAHLGKADVKPGDIVKAGQIIGLLGRTGKNAYPHRSPTHVHFMCLAFNNGKMTAINTYKELLKAKFGANTTATAQVSIK